MISRNLLALGASSIVLVACESGDINIDPATNVSNSNNTNVTGGTGSANEVCASYVTTGGQKLQGTYDSMNCTYSPSFLDAGKNLEVDMTIPALPNNGAHIFQGSLFVGKTYSSNAALTAAGITKGGDGPVLTVEAGATVAFASNKQFLIVNRGSQIFAVGTPSAPITFTSLSDVNGTVGPEDVQQWGGLVINGFGITNQCAYTGSVAGGDLALSGECHVDAEGSAGLDESQYGGNNNDDSSGRLEYVVVKHTGAEVANGDELNGISFGAVGRNTIVKNLEMYSTYDDGIEMFGGAVNIDNYLAVYVRDDSIDIDEGYSGTITNALVIQSNTHANNCIEADGVADYDNRALAGQVEPVIAAGINSRPTINHLTCIIGETDDTTVSIHGPSAGWRLREGIFPTINDSMVIGSFAANGQLSATDNYCIRIDNRTQQAALDGDVHLNSVVFVCAEKTAGQTFPGGVVTEQSFVTSQGGIFATIPTNTVVKPTAATNPELQLLEGTQPVYSIEFATSQVDGATPAASAAPTTGTFLGGVALSVVDWTEPWAYGIDPANRAEPLWFE